MKLTVTNLKNQFSMNNAIYLSTELAKDPSKAVSIQIQSNIFKCLFTSELERTKIGLSKNYREFLNVDLNKEIKAYPYEIPENHETGLSYVLLEINQVIPKPDPNLKNLVDDQELIETLRKKQTNFFFNYGQSKYVKTGDKVFSAKVTKCYLIMTGSQKETTNKSVSGRLVQETQIELSLAPNSSMKLISAGDTTASIFRPDFKIEDMGIGGLDEELFNIFRRTFASRRFSTAQIKRFGIKHVKGIILFGPPGTGKTLIARKLAQALNVKDLKIINGPQIFSKYVGESEQNIRKLFAQARNDENKLGDKSPLHIIVFDEIDAICKQRGQGGGGVGSQVNDQVVNQLLTNIDGVEALNNIVVIGMTNRKDLLDTAILRPGRFEVHIEVKLPDAKGREQILKIHTKDLRKNKILASNVKLDELARLTKNFTGAQIQSLVKSASSHCLSRTTNILDFSKELAIDENNLRVQMQDFIKALEEVKPQFGVDEQKFSTYFREKPINYGQSYDLIMNTLQQTTVMKDNIMNQKRSVILYGPPGTGKTTIAINFAKHTPFSFLKIISPENYVGLSDFDKIRSISKIFEDAYKTTNACLVIDSLEQLVDYCAIGKRYSNQVLQTLLLLLEKTPPRDNCKLLIIATTSSYYHLDEVGLTSRFDVKLQVPKLKKAEIQSFMKEKYGVKDEVSKKVAVMVEGSTIKNMLDLADLVDKKDSYQEWEYYWQNIVGVQEEEEEIQTI